MHFLLWVKISKSSRNKLEHLYNLYKEDMFYVAYSVVKDYHLAQDVVHSSFIKIADNLDKIGEEESKKTRAFIIIIVRNTAIDLLRKRIRTVSSLDEIENLVSDGSESVEDEVINAEMFNTLLERIGELPSAYGDLILLKYVYHLSDQELAEMMGISIAHIRVRISRARRKLREMLGEEKEVLKHG